MVMFGEAAFSAKFVAGEGGGDSASVIQRTFLSLVIIMLFQSAVRHVIVTTLGLFLSAYLIFCTCFVGCATVREWLWRVWKLACWVFEVS